MTKRLKRISPLQLGKVSGILYALSTLLFVPFILLFSALASALPQAEGGVPMSGVLGVGLGFIIMAPIMYGVMGFIAGVVGAFFYNIVASWVGGIEVEVE
ncbi:MAG: hypothetical protein ACI9ZV_000716 [Candidatus Azotimanducaceae bacterium]|jgi:hypothetical protein